MTRPLFLIVALFLTACGSSTGGPDIPPKPLATLIEDRDNAFEVGMIQTGLVEVLRQKGPYTLYLPTSDAFERVLREAGLTEAEFLELDDLEEILGYHIALGTPFFPAYQAGESVQTVAGDTLKLQATDQTHASVNGIKLTSTLYDTTPNTNGEYEVIDGLLVPPGVSLP